MSLLEATGSHQNHQGPGLSEKGRALSRAHHRDFSGGLAVKDLALLLPWLMSLHVQSLIPGTSTCHGCDQKKKKKSQAMSAAKLAKGATKIFQVQALFPTLNGSSSAQAGGRDLPPGKL